MTKKSDAPAIRFKGFSDAWEQRKLGELVDRVVRKNINNESTLPLTISAQYGLVDQITYFNNRVASRDVSNYYLVLNGEFAYNKSTSDGYPFGAVKRLDLYEKGVLSTLYIVFAPKKEQQIDSDYLTVFFDTDRWHKGVAERAAEGARNHGLLNISAEDFFDIDLSVPKDIVEQKQIGAFIRQLDNLITLHQRKFEKLTNVKKSMLEKMFPQNGSSYPEIRFKGFTDPWEQRKFSELVQIERGGSPRPIDDFITDAPNGLNWIKIGDAPTQGNYITKTAEKIRPEGLSKTREVHPGDLILSNSMSFGKPYIMGIDGCIHDGWLLIRNTYGVFDLTFLCHLLGTPQMLSQYRSLAAGSTVNNLNKELVGNTVVTIPSITEQRVLGDYLEQLDNLITLHQRQPFLHSTPEISLTVQLIHPFYTSSWEQRKFEEIAVRSSVICSDDTLPRVEYEDIVSGTGRLNKDIYAKQSIKSGIAFHQGDVLYGKLRPYLQNWLLPTFDGLAVGDFWVLQPQNADSSFLYRLIQSRQFDEVANQSTGTKMPRADWKLVSKTVFSIPSNISEQASIGTYFTALDSLITLHQRKGKAAVTGCSNDANNSKGVYCKARDFGYKCYKKVKSQQIRCLIAVFIFFV